PSNLDNFVGLGTVDGMRPCRAGHFKPFNTTTTGYEDNVVSWPSVEPASDYTANSTLAFALAAAARQPPGAAAPPRADRPDHRQLSSRGGNGERRGTEL